MTWHALPIPSYTLAGHFYIGRQSLIQIIIVCIEKRKKYTKLSNRSSPIVLYFCSTRSFRIWSENLIDCSRRIKIKKILAYSTIVIWDDWGYVACDDASIFLFVQTLILNVTIKNDLLFFTLDIYLLSFFNLSWAGVIV